MTLNELKKMIKEEYTKYSRSTRMSRKRKRFQEQALPGMDAPAALGGPGGPPEPSIAVSDDDVDVSGMNKSDDPESILRDIFNTLN